MRHLTGHPEVLLILWRLVKKLHEVAHATIKVIPL